jgi:pimeloyl-ACP methyl ester carboxylesterase
VPADFTLADYADCLAAVIGALELGPAHVAGLSWGGTVALELYRRRPELVATLLLADTYAGWKGSLPEAEVRVRVTAMRKALAAPASEFDARLPGALGPDPPRDAIETIDAMAAATRPATLEAQLLTVAEADQRDVLARIDVPTLLIWGDQDIRSPLYVARQFETAIPGSQLVVIPGAGHCSSLEDPARVNDAIREFCLAHPA